MRSDLVLSVDLPRDPIQSTIIVSRLLEKLKLARQLLESSAIIDGDKDSDDDDDGDDDDDDDDDGWCECDAAMISSFSMLHLL